MSAGVLRYTMVVRHPETDEVTALLGGEAAPDWASGLVQAEDLTGGGSESTKRAAAKRSK